MEQNILYFSAILSFKKILSLGFQNTKAQASFCIKKLNQSICQTLINAVVYSGVARNLAWGVQWEFFC